MRKIMLLCFLLAVAPFAVAIDTEGPLPSAELQARFERLTFELRCLVCQNQNIADSNADLARDLRDQVREMLLAGKSDDEILAFMTDRYGDFVLYRPSFSPRNWLLWGAPLLFLGLGTVVIVQVVRRQAARADSASEDDNGQNA